MTDAYYKKEDDMPDTPDMLVANHDAHMKSLDGLVEQTASQLTEAEQALGWLYQEAEKRDDQDAMTAANNAWQIANQFAVRVTQFDAVRLASIAMMHRFNDLHRKLAHEYDDLEDALVEGDESHPLVAHLSAEIQEQAWEDMEDMAYDAAYDDAHEAVFYDVMMEAHSRLHEVTGSDDWGAINRLANVLMGGEDPTDRQRDLLKQLLDSFEQVAMGKVS
jgi:hypothetical protein